MIVAHDRLRSQVEAQISRIIFPELPLVLHFIPRCLLHLHVFEVVLAFSLPFCIISIVVFGVTFVPIVH